MTLEKGSLPYDWKKHYDQVPVQAKAKHQADDIIVFKPMIFPSKTGRHTVHSYKQLHEICRKIKLGM